MNEGSTLGGVGSVWGKCGYSWWLRGGDVLGSDEERDQQDGQGRAQA